MKRVILCASALLAGGFAMAQQPAPQTVPTRTAQTIAPRVVTIPTAGASAGSNYSDIDQAGIGSDATVKQQGTAQGSFISQVGSDNANRNDVVVRQWGNVTALSGEGNYGEVDQNGAGNTFYGTQEGDFNQMFSTQVGLDNDVYVQQGDDTAEQAEGNLAIVDQDGSINVASVEQRFDNNQSSITQRNSVGAISGNVSYQDQVANPNQSAGHVAIGEQWGEGNELAQFQVGPGDGNYAEALQGNATDAAQGGFVQQVQTGSLNEAYATQIGVDNTLYQEQDGSGNTAQAIQADNPASGNDMVAMQYQSGDDHSAYVKQNGSLNEAYQEQFGEGNISNIEQRGGVNPLEANLATTLQSGALNQSDILQKTRGNVSFVDQLGNGHQSIINQNANGTSAPGAQGFNTATVSQRNANVSFSPAQSRTFVGTPAAQRVRNNNN
ncbi:hypothetical protein [Nonlabens ponticola]|uniref:Curlin n=1 Tax=Nonlabens ponticola TaxID=2496866 RepID=A0A3S9MY56_9FLAO|nr:hypothetical protein [Nonlabens ponticola]AZQ44072.1 hypothetical protein EJ995_07450 [Nonlabens ponticola]